MTANLASDFLVGTTGDQSVYRTELLIVEFRNL